MLTDLSMKFVDDVVLLVVLGEFLGKIICSGIEGIIISHTVH